MRDKFSFLEKSPHWLKKISRSHVLAVPFGIYVNLRTLFQNPPFFGQLNEDEELQKWLPENQGSYLDIGAGYPVRGSNTFSFYKRGWRGIAIEPIRANTIIFKLFRRRDKVISKLVGKSSGSSYFYHFEPYEYSTTDSEIALQQQIRTDTRLISRRKVRQISIADLEICVSPLEPALLSVDAEGADLEILKGIPWDKYCPRVICVEEWADRINPNENVTTFLNSQAYTLVANLSPSLIFVANEYLESLNRK